MKNNAICFVVAIAALTFSVPASAASTFVTLIPSAWRLENYSNNEVAVWTGGTTENCQQIIIGSNWTSDDRNRLWSTVMTGKVSETPIFVFFDDTTCQLISFGLVET